MSHLSLRRGAHAAVALLCAGALLVADRLARSLTRPVTELANTAHRLGSGDMSARATPAGPAEVREVATAVNRLAGRIGELLDAERGIEDGPGWWAARAAIEAVEHAAGRPPTRHLRTAYRPAPPADGAAAAPDGDDEGGGESGAAADAVNAALLCRDHLVGSLSDRSLRLLRGLMHPETTQGQLAEREGISASAVSQRVRSDGIGAVLAAHELLRGMP